LGKPTATAGLMQQVADLDDLVLQYDGADAGKPRLISVTPSAYPGATRAIDAGRFSDKLSGQL